MPALTTTASTRGCALDAPRRQNVRAEPGTAKSACDEALALVGERGDGLLGALAVGAVVRDDGRAAGADRGRGRGADAARGAGDDNGLAGQVGHSIPRRSASSCPVMPGREPARRGRAAASATSSTVAIRPSAVCAAAAASASLDGDAPLPLARRHPLEQRLGRDRARARAR